MSALHCRQQSVCTYSIMPLEIPSAHPSNNRWVRIVLSFVRDLQIWYHRLCRPIGDLWCEGLWEKVGDNWKKIMFSDPLSGNSCQPLAAIAILYDLGRCTTFFFALLQQHWLILIWLISQHSPLWHILSSYYPRGHRICRPAPWFHSHIFGFEAV